MTKTAQITVRVTEEELEHLRATAMQNSEPMSALVRKALFAKAKGSFWSRLLGGKLVSSPDEGISGE